MEYEIEESNGYYHVYLYKRGYVYKCTWAGFKPTHEDIVDAMEDNAFIPFNHSTGEYV